MLTIRAHILSGKSGLFSVWLENGGVVDIFVPGYLSLARARAAAILFAQAVGRKVEFV